MKPNPLKSIKNLEQILGITFKNKKHIQEALTHSSFSSHADGSLQYANNERLEFFGDAILKMIISEYLIETYPNASEGKLTKIRSQLISDKSLTHLASTLDLGSFLYLSNSEIKSGGRLRASILANALEALIAAIYKDQGLKKTQTFLIHLFEQNHLDISNIVALMDYKSALQEILQKNKECPPDYHLNKVEGPDHLKQFFVAARFTFNGKNHHFKGLGSTKKNAEQDAAKKAISEIPEL